jgi:Fic family protein
LSALLRVGMAHLYFVSIHPFEDGNDRIGRVLAEKYIHITDATRATATRDLQDLVGKGAFRILCSVRERRRESAV